MTRVRALGVALVALIGGGLPASAGAADLVGDPLPAVSRTWDALAADFDAGGGRDIAIAAHDNQHGHRGGIYLADGAGGWRLGFPFPRGDRHGCDSGDVDGDGRLDLYCAVGADRGTGSGLNNLFIQQPDGSFVDEAAAWGVQDPLGRGRRPLLYDHNGDGRLDLYLTNAERTDGASPGNRLYINKGDRFVERVTDATGNLGYRCVAHGDIDGDGRQDLVVCDIKTLRIYKNKGFGHRDVSILTGAPIDHPRDAQLADLNGDGLDDLVLVRPGFAQIRLNRGFGRRFSRPAKTIRLVDGSRALVRDLTGDGVPDVYVTDGCTAEATNARDRLLVGPSWSPVTPLGDPGGSCTDPRSGAGLEPIDADKLVVLNGTGKATGPINVRSYPLALP